VEQFFNPEQDPGECVDLIGDPNREPTRRHEIAQWRVYLVRELPRGNVAACVGTNG